MFNYTAIVDRPLSVRKNSYQTGRLTGLEANSSHSLKQPCHQKDTHYAISFHGGLCNHVFRCIIAKHSYESLLKSGTYLYNCVSNIL